MRVISRGVAIAFLAAASSASARSTYTVEYVITPANVMVHALADSEEKKRKCNAINAESTTPELVQRLGGHIVGWAFVKSASTFGYVAWITEKSGVHTTFAANYLVKNCALSETRNELKAFDGSDRYAKANVEYNRLILDALRR